MAKHITEQDARTGRIVTGKAPKKAKAGDFDIAVVSTRRQRIARALWH